MALPLLYRKLAKMLDEDGRKEISRHKARDTIQRLRIAKSETGAVFKELEVFGIAERKNKQKLVIPRV